MGRMLSPGRTADRAPTPRPRPCFRLWSDARPCAPGPSATSYVVHYCAETALLRGDPDRALALLDRAVAAGWRDYYLRQHDPYWAALEGNARYRGLMAKVKADVDRQRRKS